MQLGRGKEVSSMRSLGSSLLVIALAALLSLPTAVLGGGRYVPDEILVRYRTGKRTAAASVASAKGMQVRRTIDQIRFHVVKLPQGLTVEKAIERVKNDPNVEYAGPNHMVFLCAPQKWPNDPILNDYYDLWGWGLFLMPNQWSLFNDGYNWGLLPGTYRADIRAPEAWYITTGSPSVIIASIDTGVDDTHPDLIGKVLPGYNAPLNNTNSSDIYGHGTWTSGIAAANTNNNQGVAGVAWGAKILPINVFSGLDWMGNPVGNDADIAVGILWAVDHSAKILNLSLGTYDQLPAIEQAVNYAWNHGCLIVCSSGNDGNSTPVYPAAYAHALAVGATNSRDGICTSSDWESGGGSSYGPHIDVCAPGQQVTSTWSGSGLDHEYLAADGTSGSAPIVSGIAALIWSIHPDWTNQQVFDQICHTADDKGSPGWDQYYGWGRVNAYRALTETVTNDPIPSIGLLKRQPVGTYARLQGKVITAGTGQVANMAYIEEPDRTSGIMVHYPAGVPSGFVLGDRVNVDGTLTTLNGELVLSSAAMIKVSSGTQIKPLGITAKQITGPTAAMLRGLLVKVWGTVTEVGWGYFYIDDGSGLLDSLGVFPGLRINVPSTTLQPGDRAWVVGVLGRDLPSGAPSSVPVIRPRRPADVSAPIHQ